MQLRPYQQQLKNDIYSAISKGALAPLVVLPTGGGKSVVIASIVDDLVKKQRAVTLIAHREELIEQLASYVPHHNPQIIRAGRNNSTHSSLVHVAMVQTLANRNAPLVSCYIVDEAHHATATTYTRILDAQPHAMRIGFTATPQRLDGKGLGEVFDTLVLGPSMQELVELGYLTPARVFAYPIADNSLAAIKKTAGDYNKKHLELWAQERIIYGDLLDAYANHGNNQQLIIYAASVALAHQYAQAYTAAGIPVAAVDGTTPPAERKKIISDFRHGSLRGIANCNIVTEGLDIPNCSVVQLARPTASLALYMQMVGRPLRTAANKTHAIILDHANNCVTHGLPHAPREWSLAGRIKKPKATITIECETVEQKKKSNMTHDTAVELIEVTTDEYLIMQLPLELQKHINDVIRAGYKKRGTEQPDYNYAYRKWRNETKTTPDINTLKAFAKLAGYHHQWVNHQ